MAGERRSDARRHGQIEQTADRDVDEDAALSRDERQLLAEARDTKGNYRDLAAVVSDLMAERRDDAAAARDAEPTGEPGQSRHDRAAARDREHAAADRARAGADRVASRHDRLGARWARERATREGDQAAGRLRDVLVAAEEVAETNLLVGQAQGMLMYVLELTPEDALLELCSRAVGDGVGLAEAAGRIVGDSQNL